MRNHDRPVSGNHPGTVPSHCLPVEPRIPLDFRAEKRSAQVSAHPLSQAQGGLFCVLTMLCWLCLFVAGVLSEMHEVRTFAPCKVFLLDMFAFFSSLENYFGFRTTNVKWKTGHSISLRWNKRFWTFLKRRVFFWLCIRLIYELISPGWIKTCLYSVISCYGYFLCMPRFITFAEQASSLSSVKESYCCYNAPEWTNLCAY